MIYELRIYTIKPGTTQEYYEKFHESFEDRQKLSRMIGIFHTDVGDLNKIMHIWEYEDHGQRAQIRAETSKHEWWPPPTGHLLRKQITKIVMTPAFRPEPRLGEYGSVYEFRTYTLFPGKLGEMAEKWTPNIAAREELSPLSAVFMTESGELNQWIHVWAYKDANERNEIREKTKAMPNWPSPATGELIESQLSEIWIPGPYSLMK